MLTHEFTKRVRYGETDQMGYLYYGNHAHYYEIGRAEMLRSLGMTYKDMEEKMGVMLPVTSLQMRFVRPAYYDELLTIRTTLKKLPKKFIVFEVEIFNEKKKLVNGGKIQLCFMDRKERKTIPPPEFFLKLIRPFFE